jgi:hypothetical protein
MFFATVPKTQVPFGFHQRIYSVSFVTDYQLFNFLFIRYHFKVYSCYYSTGIDTYSLRPYLSVVERAGHVTNMLAKDPNSPYGAMICELTHYQLFLH